VPNTSSLWTKPDEEIREASHKIFINLFSLKKNDPNSVVTLNELVFSQQLGDDVLGTQKCTKCLAFIRPNASTCLFCGHLQVQNTKAITWKGSIIEKRFIESLHIPKASLFEETQSPTSEKLDILKRSNETEQLKKQTMPAIKKEALKEIQKETLKEAVKEIPKELPKLPKSEPKQPQTINNEPKNNNMFLSFFDEPKNSDKSQDVRNPNLSTNSVASAPVNISNKQPLSKQANQLVVELLSEIPDLTFMLDKV